MKTFSIYKSSFTLLLLVFIYTSNFSQTKPNILFILLDDLGYSDVGFMPDAAKDIYTPHIDELADQGTVFTSAHVTHPYCGPSRTSIMTGRMPHPIGAQFNLAAYSGNGIDTTETYFSKILDDSDYYTGLVGKWHLGEEDIYHPNNRGFDYFYGFLGGGHEYFSDTWLNHNSYNPSNYNIGNYNGEYKRPMMKNSEYIATEDGVYCTDDLTDAGIEFLNNAASDTEPFFLFMSYNAPHTPVAAKQTDIDAISAQLGNDAAAEGSERLTYTAMVYNVDYNVKRLIDVLKNNGEYDNTVIVFLSDNGGKTSKGAVNLPLRAGKGSTYEGGFRVPMFIHWPSGNVPQGATNPYNFSSLDLYPTFVHLAEGNIPNNKTYDGLNVWDNVVNNTDPRKDSTIFVMRHHNGNNNTGVVKNNFKLFTTGNGTWNLYDLAVDIGEKNNLAYTYPDIVDSMKLAAYQWTWSHIRPKFFDNPSYGFEDSWNNTNMPNWVKTFGSLYNPDDYTTSTISLSTDSKVYLYPNPAQSKINIELDDYNLNSMDAGIYDMKGRLIQLELNLNHTTKKSYTFKIDSKIPNGQYIFKAKIGKDSITEPIVIFR